MESTLGWRPVGDVSQRVCDVAEEFCRTYEHDSAFNDVCFQLRRVCEELEVLTASPGKREVLRAGLPGPRRGEGLGGA